MSSEWLIPLLTGAILIVATSNQRFRTGSGDRATTDLARYFLGQAAYAVTPLTFYCLFSYYLHALGWDNDLPWGGWKYLLFALVVLALPLVPGLRQLDRWLRGRSRELAGTQARAVQLCRELIEAELALPEGEEQALQAILRRRGYSNDWLMSGGPLTDSWRKVSTLRLRLRVWERSTRYSRFMEGSRPIYGELRNRYDQLSFRLMRSLDVVEQLDQLIDAASESDAATASLESLVEREVCEVDPQLQRPVSATKRLLFEELRVDVDLLLRDFCMFIARGVLTVGVTAADRSRQIKKLGLQFVEGSRYEILAPAFALFVGILLGAFKLFQTGGPPEERVPRALMIATLLVIALCVAILPKRRFAFANRDIRGRLPRLFFVTAGIVAFLINVPIRLALMAAIKRGDADGAWTASWSSLETDWPWLLMSSTLAVVTAVLVQDGTWRRFESQRTRRLMDGLTLAAALGVMIIPVQFLLSLTGGDSVEPTRVPLLALVGALLGFVIGFLVPWSFRTVPRSKGARFVSSALGLGPTVGPESRSAW